MYNIVVHGRYYYSQYLFVCFFLCFFFSSSLTNTIYTVGLTNTIIDLPIGILVKKLKNFFD